MQSSFHLILCSISEWQVKGVGHTTTPIDDNFPQREKKEYFETPFLQQEKKTLLYCIHLFGNEGSSEECSNKGDVGTSHLPAKSVLVGQY